MKGTIVKCLEDMVKASGGAETWKAVLVKAGLSAHSIFTTTGVVEDAEVMKLVGSAAEVLKINTQTAMNAFGEFWSTTFAPRLYGVYFSKAKNAREFLLSLDAIHVAMTKSMAGAKPPHFTYEDTGPKSLVMHYNSPRGLTALMAGLIQGVAKFYHEKVTIRAEGNAFHIAFS